MTDKNPFEEDKQLKMIEYATKAILEKQDEQIKKQNEQIALIQQSGKAMIDCQNLQLKYLSKISSNVFMIAFFLLISFLVGCITGFSFLGRLPLQ